MVISAGIGVRKIGIGICVRFGRTDINPGCIRHQVKITAAQIHELVSGVKVTAVIGHRTFSAGFQNTIIQVRTSVINLNGSDILIVTGDGHVLQNRRPIDHQRDAVRHNVGNGHIAINRDGPCGAAGQTDSAKMIPGIKCGKLYRSLLVSGNIQSTVNE